MTLHPATAVLRRSPLLLCAVMGAGCSMLARSTTSMTVMGVKVTIERPAAGFTVDADPEIRSKGGSPEKGFVDIQWDGGGVRVDLTLSKPGDSASPRILKVNKKVYGAVNPGDEMLTDGVTVRVNGTVRNEEKPAS